MGNNNSGLSKELNKRSIKNFGLLVDIPDARDLTLAVPGITPLEKVDLRNTLEAPKVFDQGQLGSCAAFAALTALMYDIKKNRSHADFNPSALFVYYNQQITAGHSTASDCGGSIRDALKVINKLGVCSEEFHIYDTVFYSDKPSRDAYVNAEKNRVDIIYKRLRAPSANDLMVVLTYKVPVMFGFVAYESFESEETRTTGVVRVPGKAERILGATAAVIIGYSARNRTFTCVSSRGTKWGSSGHFWMPFEYMTSMFCTDFWVLYSGNKPVSRPVSASGGASGATRESLVKPEASGGQPPAQAAAREPPAPQAAAPAAREPPAAAQMTGDTATVYEFREEDNVSYEFKSDDESRV